MRYKVEGDIIKTENAAKPDSQGSAYLRQMIADLEPVASSFDYGCGKLRYRNVMLRSTETLALVDSEIQVSREQIICGRRTSIRDSARSSNRVSVHNTGEFVRTSTKFDRGFCINVLSVVPFSSARRHIVQLILQKLRPGGTCLFAVQYRNSDFNRMRHMQNARSWRDGFLVDSLRGVSFYGLISPEKLTNLITRAGFFIEGMKLNEGSVYVLAKSPMKRPSQIITGVNEGKNFKISILRATAPADQA